MNTWAKISIMLLVAGFLGAGSGYGAPIRVLIVDGQCNHDWQAGTADMKRAFGGAGDRFAVTVATTPPKGSAAAAWDAFRPQFSQQDMVLLNYFGDDWPEDRFRALEEFVRAGGGLVVVHASLAAFASSEAYSQMIGVGWRGDRKGRHLYLGPSGKIEFEDGGNGAAVGHCSRRLFALTVRESSHAVTATMPPVWMHTKDELYHGLRGPAENMTVLATGESPVTKVHEPLLWTVTYGKGRVFCSALGHDSEAMNCVGFADSLLRGSIWAATGAAVALNTQNFPTADQAATGLPVWGQGVTAAAIQAHAVKDAGVHGDYTLVQLPLSKGVAPWNPTVITPGPEGVIYAGNYTGEIYALVDSDGDGLEDTARLFVNVRDYGKEYENADAVKYGNSPAGPGLRYPTGLLFKGNVCYVACTQEIHCFEDTDGDGKADKDWTFAKDWPFTMHYFDWTFGLRFGPDGYLYTILCTDYLNKDHAEDPRGLRGSMLRISPDGKSVERFAYGLRFAYDLAFNGDGEVFFTDNQGGDNPTEELNHAVRGSNYKHHPKLPDANAAARDPLLRTKYGFGAGGLEFNPTTNTSFGDTGGDAFMAMWGPDGRWNMGSVVRVRLTKDGNGSYTVEEFQFIETLPKVIDLCFSPTSGDLYLARFGREGRAHTPFAEPEGGIFRVIHTPGMKSESAGGMAAGGDNPLLSSTQVAGDPVKGKTHFEQRACITCHSVDGTASKLGPDLKQAGWAMGYDGLVDAVNTPAANIKTDYETYALERADGSILQGRFMGRDEEGASIMVPGNAKVTVPAKEIRSLNMVEASLMPPNLLAGLKEADIRDLLAYLCSLDPRPMPELRINVGGGQVTDADGRIWQADRDYDPLAFGAIGGNRFIGENIADPVAATCRWGDLEYRIPVLPGVYQVSLIAAEPYFKGAGQRVFSATVEGAPVFDKLDSFAESGFGKRVVRTVEVTVKDGAINVLTTAAVNNAILSGIEIHRLRELQAAGLEWRRGDGDVALMHGGTPVWAYNYGSTKPYFHPLTVPGGTVVTALRPADHVWHLGGWFSFKYINGLNYWEESGGKAEGLTEVLETTVETHDDYSATIHQRLGYRPPGEGQARLLEETRTVQVSAPDAAGRYTIDWDHQFLALQAVSLERTPIAGQENGKNYGGYAGNSVRLSAALKDWGWLDSEGRTAATAIHGSRARWLQTVGPDGGAVAMIENTENRGHPNAWYVAAGMPYFSSAFIFNEGMALAKEAQLRLRYRIIFAEKALSPAELDAQGR